jgi:hypothetical protein
MLDYYKLYSNGGFVHSMKNQATQMLVDKLYNAVSNAEMSEDYYKYVLNQNHPYLRTSEAPPGGSTAYGPLQLTSGKNSMVRYILGHENHDLRTGNNYLGTQFTDAEMEYLDKFVDQGEKFLLYGAGDWKKLVKDGTISQKEGERLAGIYEYGKEGDLFSKEDRLLYDSIGKKILSYEYFDQAKGDSEVFLKNWKMGSSKTMEEFVKWAEDEDAEEYIDRFNTGLETKLTQ